MKALISKVNKLSLAAGLCICLALLNIVQFYVLSDITLEPSVTTPQQIGMPDIISINTTADDAEKYHVIVERPLFEPDRKPFVKKVDAPEIAEVIEPIKPKQITKPKLPQLLGIMKVKDEDIAFVAGDVEPVALKPGDDFHGWAVKEVQPNHILLVLDGTEEVVRINWDKQISSSASDKLRSLSGEDVTSQSRASLKDRLSRIMR